MVAVLFFLEVKNLDQLTMYYCKAGPTDKELASACQIAESEKTVLQLIDKYNIDCISVGNGTASKEAEIFVADTIVWYRVLRC